MPDAFTITLIFIVLAAMIGAFVRRVKRDKCLKHFQANIVTLQETSGKLIWGKLSVENTGLEFVYPEKHKDPDGHDETTYVLYKYEYPNIQALIRYHDQLSSKNQKKRQDQLKIAYHPSLSSRIKRKILNFFKTIRDSVLEILNVLVAHAKKAGPAGTVLTSQDKYVSQMKQELAGSVGTSYEPLLEKYIGRKVVLEIIKADKVFEYCGVLKEYTADFLEVMDVNYKLTEEEPTKIADLVVPRKSSVIRHLAE